ncbi:hypothetical protein A6R68_03018, partial [Neotoma lepida]
TVTSSSPRAREDSWLKSLFVRKVDPRKDAHSNLLAKKETSSLYKLQFHNVKPECLDAYNKIWRNQLLLEFSFWNEPVPRSGPNIYELRSYQLRLIKICRPGKTSGMQHGTNTAGRNWCTT